MHSLEHGYVVILYDCSGPCDDDLLDALELFLDDTPESAVFGYAKIVISPYDGLPYPLAAIAWDVQMHLEEFDEDALLEFYNRYLDQGPELAP